VTSHMGLRVADGKVYDSWIAKQKEITARREHPGSIGSPETCSPDLHP